MEATITPTENTAWVNISMKEGEARYIDQDTYDKCLRFSNIFALNKKLQGLFVKYNKPIKPTISTE